MYDFSSKRNFMKDHQFFDKDKAESIKTIAKSVATQFISDVLQS